MSSPDKPFVLRGGNDEQTAIYNRIAAIERIKFLTGGIDLRAKNTDYLKFLDLELWVRWYRNEPAGKKIDEEFCQRAARVVRDMEGQQPILSQKKYDEAVAEHQSKLEEQSDADPKPEGGQKDAGQAHQQVQNPVRTGPVGRSHQVPRKRKNNGSPSRGRSSVGKSRSRAKRGGPISKK